MKKLFLLLIVLFLASSAFALTVNISTINTPGEDYDTLTLWEDATDGQDHTVLELIERAECYDDDSGGVLTENSVTYAGALNTTEDWHREVTVPEGERHDGTTTGGGFTHQQTASTANFLELIYEDYFIFEWVLIDKNGNNYAGTRVNNNNCIIRRCISTNAVGSSASGFYFYLADGCSIENCIATDNQARGYAISMDSAETLSLYNCTSYDSVDGFEGIGASQGTINMYNCLSYNNSGKDFQDNGDGNFFNYYCMSEDATANDYGGLPLTCFSSDTGNNIVVFVNAAGGDLHLITGDDAIDRGNDLSGSISEDKDIDDDNRPIRDNWDIGADESSCPEFPVEFISTINTADEDFDTFTLWEDATDKDLVDAGTQVYSHGGVTGSISAGDTLTGEDSGVTGIIIAYTTTQIVLESVSDVCDGFNNGEQMWETLDTNYVVSSSTGSPVIIVAEGYDDQDQPLVDQVALDGAIQDNKRFRKITSPIGERHDATVAGGGFTMQASGHFQTVIQAKDNYTEIEHIKIDLDNYQSKGIGIVSTDNCKISHNLLYNMSDAGDDNYIQCAGGSFIWNNITYDDGTRATGIHLFTFDVSYTYNNTCVGGKRGIFRNGGTANHVIKNNICNGATDDYVGAFSSASTHNVGENALTELIFGDTWSSSNNIDGQDDFHLIDSSEDFPTIGVQVGSVVENVTTGATYSYVLAVADGDLTLNDNIFPDDDGDEYAVYTNMFGAVTFNNEGVGDLHLDGADTVAIDKGIDLTGDGNIAVTDDINGDSRNVPNSVGADYIPVGPTQTPTPTPTQTQTQTQTATQTVTATATQTVTATPTETVTATDTVTATATQTITATPTETVTQTLTVTATETETNTPTPTQTVTATPACDVIITGPEQVVLYDNALCGPTTDDLDYTGENCYSGSFQWSSDDESVATVDGDGVVTAISVGIANITIQCSTIPGCSDVAEVTVTTCITATPTQTQTTTVTNTLTATPTETATPTQTLTPTVSPTLTVTATQTLTGTATITSTPTITDPLYYEEIQCSWFNPYEESTASWFNEYEEISTKTYLIP